MTFGHHTFDHYASEEVRLFRTGPTPPITDACLEFFDEHKEKSLYPAMGSSDLFKPDKRLTYTGVTECACACLNDPTCIAFHIATVHSDSQHVDKCWFWSKDVKEDTPYAKNGDDRPPTSKLGPEATGTKTDSYILKTESEIDILLAERETYSMQPPPDQNGNGDVSDCPECPPNHMKAKSNGECTCISGEAIGKGLGTIGKGLGMLAIGGVLVTGIVVYGLYRVIRG